MGAVGYVGARDLRRHWASTLVVVVLIGLAGGAVLAAVAGARRTASSYTRLLRAINASDVLVNPQDSEGYPYAEAARLPQVERSSLVIGEAATLLSGGNGDGASDVLFGTTDGGVGLTSDIPYDMSGRMPRGADEAFMSRRLARRLGLRVGQSFKILHVVSSGDEAGRGEKSETLDLTVTGIGATLDETLQPDGLDDVFMAPAFRAEHPGPIAFAGLLVHLRGGERDLPAFTQAVERLAGGGQVFLQRQSATTAKAQQGLRPYAGALGAFAAALALTALLVLGQALSRHLAVLGADDETLTATGMSRRQLSSLAALRAGLLGVGAALVATAVALAVSPLAPIGPAHDFEPSPGLSVDGLVVPAGALAIMLSALALGVMKGSRRRSRPVASRPAATEKLATHLRPAAATGLRMALDPGRDRRTAPARTTVAGAALGLAAVTAALVLGASLDHFLSTPRLYGWAWDAQVDLYNDVGPQLETIRSAPEVLDVTPGLHGLVTVDGVSVPAVGLGDGPPVLHPPLISGRTAQTADEIVLGTATLRHLGRSIGDEVTVSVGDVSRRLRVVGRATFPRFAAYSGADKTGLGVGAQLTVPGLGAFVPEEDGVHFALVRLAGGPADGAGLATILKARLAGDPRATGICEPRCDLDFFTLRADPQRPDDLVGYDRVDRTPFVLAAVLALLAAATTAHGLIGAARRRRPDLAVLRAIGFTGGEVRAAVRWQSATVAGIGAVVGLPLGIAAGRVAWEVLADRLGTPAAPVGPASALAVLVLGTLLVALAVAETPARRAVRVHPALVLRAE